MRALPVRDTRAVRDVAAAAIGGGMTTAQDCTRLITSLRLSVREDHPNDAEHLAIADEVASDPKRAAEALSGLSGIAGAMCDFASELAGRDPDVLFDDLLAKLIDEFGDAPL